LPPASPGFTVAPRKNERKKEELLSDKLRLRRHTWWSVAAYPRIRPTPAQSEIGLRLPPPRLLPASPHATAPPTPTWHLGSSRRHAGALDGPTSGARLLTRTPPSPVRPRLPLLGCTAHSSPPALPLRYAPPTIAVRRTMCSMLLVLCLEGLLFYSYVN